MVWLSPNPSPFRFWPWAAYSLPAAAEPDSNHRQSRPLLLPCRHGDTGLKVPRVVQQGDGPFTL